MKTKFLKVTANFNFRAHKYDVGIPLWQHAAGVDRHFLNKICKLDSLEYPLFYQYHYDFYYSSTDDIEDIKDVDREKLFFEYIYHVVADELNVLRVTNVNKFSLKRKTRYDNRKSKLKEFMKLLKKKDKWRISLNIEELIKEFQKEREGYQERITELEKELKQYRVKPEHKIQITSKNKEVLADLFHQLQGLKHWENGQEFLITHSQATWSKIIANYFIEGDDGIPFNTIKKYFGSGKNRDPEKIRRYIVSPKE